MNTTKSFSTVASHVLPCIVSINAVVVIDADPEQFGPFMFQSPRKMEREVLGSGVILTPSGLVVTNDHVIEPTNKPAERITVITSDEEQYDAEIVIRDPLHDLAIIRIRTSDKEDINDFDSSEFEDDTAPRERDERGIKNKAKDNTLGVESKRSNKNPKANKNVGMVTRRDGQDENKKKNEKEIKLKPMPDHGFPFIRCGRAELCKVGDLVLAIGNNLGFHGTVTDGIISAIGRTRDKRLPITYPQCPIIQTNASINSGSSGGALLNMNGELIGINESIATSTGGNVGVGFAVPVNFVKPLLRGAIKRTLDAERVWDGLSIFNCPLIPLSQPTKKLDIVNMQASTEDNHDYKRLFPRGVIVTSVHNKSPGFVAGLKVNDIITQINDIPIDDINTFYLFIAGADPNKKLTYHVLRPNLSHKSISNYLQRKQQTTEGKRFNREDFNELIDYFRNRDTTHVLHQISVTPQPIPSPEKRPLEIKDRINPFYGATVAELCPSLNADFGLDFALQGVIVYEVDADLQAYRLGFRPGDIILGYDNGTKKISVKTLEDVEKIGDTMQFKKNCRIWFQRGNKRHHLDVFLRQTRKISRARL